MYNSIFFTTNITENEWTLKSLKELGFSANIEVIPISLFLTLIQLGYKLIIQAEVVKFKNAIITYLFKITLPKMNEF